MSKIENKSTRKTQIPFTMHPRVFAALGADLVTSDIIALMELVKNSYDACATRVDVRLGHPDKDTGELTIEVEDNGNGMDRSIIESVWSVVATPFRQENPLSKQGKRIRRASGEKGLGRLSAARLGQRMEMLTQSAGNPCWFVSVNWDKINNARKFDECELSISEFEGVVPWKKSGTLIKIRGLHPKAREITPDELTELANQLARFVPPFSEKDDFQIWLTPPGKDSASARIERPKLLDHPPYLMSGVIDEFGNLKSTYRYNFDGHRRQTTHNVLLERPTESTLSETQDKSAKKVSKTACGPLSFELRVWDLDKDVLFKLSERFNFTGKIQDLRQLISKGAYSGVSLYRDGVLVLPKTEANSDWLRLNLRRVSRVGMRLSMNQIIGYIEVGAEGNPNLRDTSDRERLVDNDASREFGHFIFQIVALLEDERSKDREESSHKEPPFTDIFEELRDARFKDTIVDLAKKQASVEQFSKAADDHEKVIDKAVEKIQTRLFYYSRLASLGTLAGILQHEVGNHSVTMDDFINRVEKFLKVVGNAGIQLLHKLGIARQSLRSVQRLSDTFSPLASQAYATRRRNCVFEATTAAVVEMLRKELDKNDITVEMPKTNTDLAVDPGEISAIMGNLFNNSIYWLSRESNAKRRIMIETRVDRESGRLFVLVHDTGPGINDGDEERIFWPGVTRKPNGLGMGLTVSSELVAQYGGKMMLSKPGKLDGATFGFDLPLKTSKS